MNALQESRLWMIGGAVATLVILLLGWLLLVSPQLTAASDVRDETASVEMLNSTLEIRIASLKESEAELPQLEADLAAGRLELPVRNDSQIFAQSLRSAAERNLVLVTSVSLGDPENVTALAQGTVETPPVVADEATESTTDTPAADVATSTTSRQTFSLPVTFTVEGPAASVDSFVAELQTAGERALSVTKIVVNPVAGIADGSIAGDIITSYSGFIYLSPLDAEAAAALFGTTTGG